MRTFSWDNVKFDRVHGAKTPLRQYYAGIYKNISLAYVVGRVYAYHYHYAQPCRTGDFIMQYQFPHPEKKRITYSAIKYWLNVAYEQGFLARAMVCSGQFAALYYKPTSELLRMIKHPKELEAIMRRAEGKTNEPN